MADLRAITPKDAMVVTDAPGLAAWADRGIPPAVVDPSYVVIGAGRISPADALQATQTVDVCAVLVWSPRLQSLLRKPGSLPRSHPLGKMRN